LLTVRVRWPVESVASDGFLKQPDESVRLAEVDLINLSGHGIGELREHDSSI
jgi:hypothetical protein